MSHVPFYDRSYQALGCLTPRQWLYNRANATRAVGLTTLPAPKPLNLDNLSTKPITITDKPKPKLTLGQIWSIERWGP